ncbi:MAG: CAP domain-containing protein [Acidobacteriota bacterium]|nr:CAP domain-containing protein [Acidobacteriota bacterium]
MKHSFLVLSATAVALLVAPIVARAQRVEAQLVPGGGEQLMALANRARAENGAGPLRWDPQLAEAARRHTLLMAQEGPIAHRYGGEDGLSDRAGKAGAHFSLIEENVAVGPSPAQIHDMWMHSPGHRSNLLNPEVNRVGIAVVRARGVLYATADYSRAVQQLSRTDIERRIEDLIRVSGLSIYQGEASARAACMTNSGMPTSHGGRQAMFVMRWQSGSLDELPEALRKRLTSGQYRMAAVGSCPAQGVQGDFSAYRVAVLLYQ